MAEPISWTPRPAEVGPDARAELECLLQTAHAHGVLRFANDLIASNNQWLQILVDGLNKEGSRKAVQNLAMVLMLLSRIEPAQLCKVLFAAKDGVEHLAGHRPPAEEDESPGLKGAYKMLNDDALWRAVTPIIGALRAFGEGLDREVQKPVSAFSGKQTRPPATDAERSRSHAA